MEFERYGKTQRGVPRHGKLINGIKVRICGEKCEKLSVKNRSRNTENSRSRALK